MQWTGRQAVVALPEHIDVSNAGHIREELLSVINRGATALIADMTATISCDHAGADAVVRAHQRAVISGAELRLVVTAQIVSRMLRLNGLDRLVSIYPSLEAATAARGPAPVLAMAARTADARADGLSPAGRAGETRAQLLTAPPPDGNGAAITPAVVWKLLDAIPDGLALAADDGAVALANRRLEELFGYSGAELLGRPVESLILAGLRAAYRSYRATCAQAPGTRPIRAGARLVGLRKDGTTFPVEISHSPVMTATGHFALTVIRDVTEAPRFEDLAELARAAVAAEEAPRGRVLLDTITTSLFDAGLSLQAAMDLPADAARQRITEALVHLDDTIREIRDTAFMTLDHDAASPPAPLNGAR